MEVLLRPHNTELIIAYTFLFISFSLLAYLRLAGQVYMIDAFKAVFFDKIAEKMWNEKNVVTRRHIVLHNIILFINLSLIIFLWLTKSNIETLLSVYELGLLAFASIFLFFLVKTVTYYVVGFLFGLIGETRVYVNSVMLIYRAFGISLFPLLLALPLLPYNIVVYVAFAALTLFFVTQLLIIIRALVLVFKTKFSVFYMFLYLCALELLPVLLIVKISRTIVL
ncbi:MAG TPA: DUF4271 domain-containing protein [Bacteroidales bacterium]|nr:DUF4271 domain-containing protein [Bacteroidales bacterium]